MKRERVKYCSTIGLNIFVNNKLVLAKIGQTKWNDGTWTLELMNANTLSKFRKVPVIRISSEEMSKVDSDPYDDSVEFMGLLSIFESEYPDIVSFN